MIARRGQRSQTACICPDRMRLIYMSQPLITCCLTSLFEKKSKKDRAKAPQSLDTQRKTKVLKVWTPLDFLFATLVLGKQTGAERRKYKRGPHPQGWRAFAFRALLLRYSRRGTPVRLQMKARDFFAKKRQKSRVLRYAIEKIQENYTPEGV